MLRRLLVGTLVVALVVGAAVSLSLLRVWRQAGGDISIGVARFYLDVYKAIGVAFLVALLAVVVPHLLPEARDQFQRFKDSRRVYSRSKTSVIYLPERLATLTFAESVAAVQDAHEKLHLAETYPSELKQHLRWHPHPETWVDRNYWELFAARKVLDLNVDRWGDLTPGKRLQELQRALAVVENEFGPDNSHWCRMPRADRERGIADALATKLLPEGANEGKKGSAA